MTEIGDQHIIKILDGCKKNERDSQEKLYRLYFPAMMNMCHRYTRDPDKAMDIVNDGFLKVFKKIHLYEHRGSLEGWIRKLVYHALSDYFRKENTYLRFMVFEEKEENVDDDALQELYFQDLMELIETLPEMSKKAFIRFAIEGYSHQEISDEFGISVGTSKWHIANARKILKNRINKLRSKRNKNYAG